MTCLCFSLIKLKCENHTQMSIRQFGFWQCALLSGFYGIFHVCNSSFIFLQRKWFPSCFSLPDSTVCTLKAPLLVQGLLTSQSNQTWTVYWTWRCQVTHSLRHSHKPPSALPSEPPSALCLPSLFSCSFLCLSLQAWQENLWPFKQTQGLNGLSVCIAVG